MELVVEDIFPMDKGDAGSTGYDMGDEIIDYRMNNPESLSWKIGMVHSHHNMDSYFSGVDMSELVDNTEFHNYYLSLVVNNVGKLVAKLAFRGQPSGFTCKDESGKDWTLTLKSAADKMFTFDCEVITPSTMFNVTESFVERTARIIKEKELKTEIVKQAWQHPKFSPNKGNKLNNPKYDSSKKTKNPFDTLKKPKHWSPSLKDMEKARMEKEIEEYNESWSDSDIDQMNLDSKAEGFLNFLLNKGMDSGYTLTDTLEALDFIEDFEEYTTEIIIGYPELYDSHFCKFETEEFIQNTAAVIELIQGYLMDYPELQSLSVGLQAINYKFELSVNGN